MKTTHTPGPWIIETNGQYNQIGNRLIIRAEKPSENLWDQICEVGIIHTGLMGGSPKANARLISAAPELLAALQFIVNDMEPGEDARLTVAGYNKACAAIKSATHE